MAGIIRLGVNYAKMTLLGDALARRAIERRSSLWVALRCARGSIDDGTGDETHDQSWCFLYSRCGKHSPLIGGITLYIVSAGPESL